VPSLLVAWGIPLEPSADCVFFGEDRIGVGINSVLVEWFASGGGLAIDNLQGISVSAGSLLWFRGQGDDSFVVLGDC
jgi:hypothetical protein